MNRRTDQQLLSDYAERRSEAAFAELVRRHIDFVYSAALRMVRNTHLAEDVTQGVLVAAAQNARQLVDCPVLPGWLHRTTENLAANAVRTDVRRRTREQEAAVMNELLSTNPDANWEHIAPHLDDALGALSEPDRDAVLLRYFKNHDLRTVGANLGISDDAAQKRVSRAVERLREFFAKRGVTVGASGLAIVISANAVQAAPVGLALTISTAAVLTGTTLASTATVTATKAIAMTALQKTIVTATIAVLAGAGIYEARQASRLRKQVQTLQQQQAPLSEQIAALQSERDNATNELEALREHNERLNRNTSELLRLRGEVSRLGQQVALYQGPSTSVESAARTWMRSVEIVKAQFEQNPERKIPELQFLSDYDWLKAARNDGRSIEADSFGENGWRSLMAELRLTAKQHFADSLGNALDEFIADNDGQLPTDLTQLNKYYDRHAGQPASMDTEILRRYEIVQNGNLRDIADFNTPIIEEKAISADPDYDTVFKISVYGYQYGGVGKWQGSRRGSGLFNSASKISRFNKQSFQPRTTGN